MGLSNFAFRHFSRNGVLCRAEKRPLIRSSGVTHAVLLHPSGNDNGEIESEESERGNKIRILIGDRAFLVSSLLQTMGFLPGKKSRQEAVSGD